MFYYMRWLDKNKGVVRVARMNGESCQAFYPGKDNTVYGEFIQEVDDSSQRIELDKGKLNDDLLLRLLSGESRTSILESFEPAIKHREEYWMTQRGSEFDIMNTRIFRLSEDLEE